MVMDAVEFLRSKERMCKAYNLSCSGREIANRMGGDESCNDYIKHFPTATVEIVEQWSKDHPRKTRQSEFLKMFPRVDMTADGVIAFCPESMDSTFVCPIKKRDRYDPECGKCRKKYWLEEVD